MSQTAAPLSHSDALPVGTALGGFTIQRVLGQGGFGITYEAHNRITGRKVAIKEFFPASMARRDGQSRLVYSQVNAELIGWAVRKFEETTTTLSRLRHPNIVEVFDYVPANETGYMVMELLDGGTLKDWLKTQGPPPSLDRLRPLVAPVMDALAYIHGEGLIHRDIAPDNIQITSQGRPVLIDFGSVSRDLSQAAAAAASGTVGLTKRHYTAPEQMSAKARPTPAADIYSMGGVLYRSLTGVEPVDGQDRVDATYLRQEPDPYRAMASLGLAGVPPAAASAVDAALSMRPEGRPQSMVAFRQAIGAGAPVVSHPGQGAARGLYGEPGPHPKPSGSFPILPVAIGGGLLALLLVAGGITLALLPSGGGGSNSDEAQRLIQQQREAADRQQRALEEQRRALDDQRRQQEEDARQIAQRQQAIRDAEERQRREAQNTAPPTPPPQPVPQVPPQPVPQLPPQPATVQPSFPCERATLPAEIAICQNSRLAALDNEMSALFIAKRNSLSGTAKAAFIRAGHAWIDQRNALCGPLPQPQMNTCLERLMSQRIQDLRF